MRFNVIKTLSILTFSIPTLSIMGYFKTLSINDSQYNNTLNIKLSVIFVILSDMAPISYVVTVLKGMAILVKVRLGRFSLERASLLQHAHS